jgi:hypothetical protein
LKRAGMARKNVAQAEAVRNVATAYGCAWVQPFLESNISVAAAIRPQIAASSDSGLPCWYGSLPSR